MDTWAMSHWVEALSDDHPTTLRLPSRCISLDPDVVLSTLSVLCVVPTVCR